VAQQVRETLVSALSLLTVRTPQVRATLKLFREREVADKERRRRARHEQFAELKACATNHVLMIVSNLCG
jgi:hypothetical protein